MIKDLPQKNSLNLTFADDSQAEDDVNTYHLEDVENNSSEHQIVDETIIIETDQDIELSLGQAIESTPIIETSVTSIDEEVDIEDIEDSVSIATKPYSQNQTVPKRKFRKKNQTNMWLTLVAIFIALVMIAINYIFFSTKRAVNPLDEMANIMQISEINNNQFELNKPKEQVIIQIAPFSWQNISGNYQFIYNPQKYIGTLQISGETSKPVPLTPEEIARKIKPRIWIKKFELEKTEINLPEIGGYISKNIPIKVFIADGTKMKRELDQAIIKIERNLEQVLIFMKSKKYNLEAEFIFSFSL